VPGALLALLSAGLFGLNTASIRRGVLTGTVLQGMSITLPIGVPLLLIVGLASGSLGLLGEFSGSDMGLLAAAGLTHFAWGRYCNYRALKAMGSNLVSPIQQSHLLMSLILAIWILDEMLTPLRILGILLVIAGPMVMLHWRRAGKNQTASSIFRPNYSEGVIFAILSVFGFGASAVLARAVLIGTSPAHGMAGVLISYLAASLTVALVLLRPGRWRHVRSMEASTAKWFTLSGLMVVMSQSARFMALSIAPVTVVSPIQQTSAVFRLLFTWLINREHERFDIWVVSGIFVSLTGTLALSISTEFVLEHVELPEVLIRLAGWTWP